MCISVNITPTLNFYEKKTRHHAYSRATIKWHKERRLFCPYGKRVFEVYCRFMVVRLYQVFRDLALQPIPNLYINPGPMLDYKDFDSSTLNTKHHTIIANS